MNKFIIFFVFTLPTCTFAQLKVDSIGRVGVNVTDSLKSSFTVGCTGESGTDAMISGAGKTVLSIKGEYIKDEYAPTSALKVENNSNIPTLTCGIEISAVNYTYNPTIIGLSAAASGGTSNSGKVFGIQSFLPGQCAMGAGLYASSGTPTQAGLDGRYAGFFQGNVKVTGTINGVVVSSSDGRLKENIEEIDDGESVLERINLLNPIKYNYKSEEADGKEMDDEMKALVEKYGNTEERPNQVMEKKHYGLVAQELQEIYPDLVYENDNGYLAVNYTELIPIMLQSIKELKAQVDEMRSPSAASAKAMALEMGETTGIDAAIADAAGMDQNVPNPFSGETDIAIYLPETVKTAMLYIYDLSGKQMEHHVIEGRGDTIMTIHADKMDAGMYIYSLIADGKVVATKRMIVVK